MRSCSGRAILPGHELDSSDRKTLIERYARQSDELAQRIKGIPASEILHPTKQAEWSAHQLLVHVRDVEAQAYQPRLERILSQANPHFEDFDAEGWMRIHYRPSEPAPAVLADFAAARLRGMALIEKMAAEDWQRPGTHPETGPRSFEWWMIRAVEHAQEHLDELARRWESAEQED